MRKPLLFSTLGLFIFIFFVGLAVFQLNMLTTVAWRVGETEEKLRSLREENFLLESKVQHALKLSDLGRLATKYKFHKITSVTYLRLPRGPVAQQE